MKHLRNLILATGGMLLLGACATAEGYRQHMDLMTGKSVDQLQIDWGVPDQTTSLTDGSELWVYHRVTENHSGGYWTTQSHSRVETYVDKDGNKQKRTVTFSEPYYEPPVTTRTTCETRFVIAANIVKSVSFEGDGCVAEEIKKAEDATRTG